jgi:hypothetical protein
MPMQYQALDIEKDEIRLFRFLPTEDDVLHLRLEHFPFNEAPLFWAFSYTWGDPTKTRRIVINGYDFDATENLVFALRTHAKILERGDEFGSNYQIKHIWVDAICINQNDYEERAKQVLRMCQIYNRRWWRSTSTAWIATPTKLNMRHC